MALNFTSSGRVSIGSPAALDAAPAGALLAVGAEMHRAAREAKTPLGAVAAGAFTPASVAASGTFLMGASGALQAITDRSGRKGEAFMESTAGSIVPAIVGAVARGVDPVQREADGVLERIQSRLPFASKSLPPKVDAFGRELERPPGGVLRQLVDPGTSRSREDDVTRELSRLGVNVGKPARTTRAGSQSHAWTPNEYRALLRDSGPAIHGALLELFASDDYSDPSTSDAERRKQVRRAISRARDAARKRERDALGSER